MNRDSARQRCRRTTKNDWEKQWEIKKLTKKKNDTKYTAYMWCGCTGRRPCTRLVVVTTWRSPLRATTFAQSGLSTTRPLVSARVTCFAAAVLVALRARYSPARSLPTVRLRCAQRVRQTSPLIGRRRCGRPAVPDRAVSCPSCARRPIALSGVRGRNFRFLKFFFSLSFCLFMCSLFSSCSVPLRNFCKRQCGAKPILFSIPPPYIRYDFG